MLTGKKQNPFEMMQSREFIIPATVLAYL